VRGIHSVRRLNIGCGVYRSAGYINIDSNPLLSPDLVRDVRRGLPFDDSSCAEVVTSHFLEHLSNDDCLFLIGEIYRVLVYGGVWSIVVPLGSTGELDHKMLFEEWSFDALLRPENSAYFQLQMKWEEVEGSRMVKPEKSRPGVRSLHLRLRAAK
jgi:predicted SAM-dependent methyltransferase